MKDWPSPFLKIRQRISPRFKESDPYSDYVLKYLRKFPYVTCIDVGGSNRYFLAKLYDKLNADGHLKLFVNLSTSSLDLVECKKEHPHLECILADAEHLPFKDLAFDVVYSISLLEHVYQPLKVIAEKCRIAKRFIIVQIPNMEFILEIHTLIPLPRFIPKVVRERMCRKYSEEFLNFVSFKDVIKAFESTGSILIDLMKLYHTNILKAFLLPLGWIMTFVKRDTQG